MPMTKPAKIPLSASFAWLCGFIGTLHTAINVLATGKADTPISGEITIPVTGWETDNTVPSHPNYIDIQMDGLLATDIVEIDVAPGSVAVARAANFSNTESYDGRLRLRAEKVPTAAISVQYHIMGSTFQENQEG